MRATLRQVDGEGRLVNRLDYIRAQPPIGASENLPQAMKTKASRKNTSPAMNLHSLRRNLVVAAPDIRSASPLAAIGESTGATPTRGGTTRPVTPTSLITPIALICPALKSST